MKGLYGRAITGILLLCLPSLPLPAQTGKARFVQRLSWEESADALYFEIQVQGYNEAGKQYSDLIREQVREPYYDCSLRAGQYRYRVTPYDFLERPGKSSPWENFTVKAALRPEIRSSEPPGLEIIRGEGGKLSIRLGGKNLEGGGSAYLMGRGGRIDPLEYRVEPSGGAAELILDSARLSDEGGDYEIHVRNPGGLEGILKGFKVVMVEKPLPPPVIETEGAPPAEPEEVVEEKEPTAEETAPTGEEDYFFQAEGAEIHTSLSYRPLIPLHGAQRDFLAPLQPASAAFRAELFALGEEASRIGIGTHIGWAYLEGMDGMGVLNSQSIWGGIDLVFRLPFPNLPLSFTGRLGVGLEALTDNDSRPGSSFSPLIEGEAALLWYVWKDFYLEAGISYSLVFGSRPPFSGFLTPSLGAGYRISIR